MKDSSTIMTLYLVGLGLGDEKDITVKGLDIVKKCKSVYLESYTSVLGISREKLVSIQSVVRTQAEYCKIIIEARSNFDLNITLV